MRKRLTAALLCLCMLFTLFPVTAFAGGKPDGGMLPAGDMTTEAAVTKLMWLLGQELPPDQVKAQFGRNLHGEVAAPGA